MSFLPIYVSRLVPMAPMAAQCVSVWASVSASDHLVVSAVEVALSGRQRLASGLRVLWRRARFVRRRAAPQARQKDKRGPSSGALKAGGSVPSGQAS